MSGNFGIKYVSILLLVAFIALNAKNIVLKRSEIVILIGMFIIWPLFSILHGVQQGYNIQSAIYTNNITIFIVIYFLFSQFINPISAFDKMNLILLSVAVLVIIVNIVIFLIPSGTSLTNIISNMADNYDEYYGVRPDSMVAVPRIYFRVTLVFVGGFAYSIFRNKYVFVAIYLAALLLSYSRGGLIVCAIIFLLFSLNNISKIKSNFTPTIIILIVSYLMLNYYSPRVTEHMEGLFASSSYYIRIDHLNNLMEIWNGSIYNLLVGFGSGSSMFSDVYGGQISNIEMSQVETIRRYGILWSFSLFTIMFFIIYNSKKYIHPSISMSLIALFLATLTNPVMQSPIFVFFYITAYRMYRQETMS